MNKIFKSFFANRINRSKYLMVYLLIFLIIILFLFNSTSLNSIRTGETSIISHLFPVVIFYSIFTIYFSIKRLHDINLSGAFSVLLFVPIIGLFFLLKLFLQKGTPFQNEYGSNPLKKTEIERNEENEKIYKDYTKKLNKNLGILSVVIIIIALLIQSSRY